MVIPLKRKFKLKKKWRFWRSFKKTFLNRRNKKRFFVKLKWLFDHNRIIKHQVLSLYGISLKKLLCKRLHLDSFFFNLLTFLELRLSSLVFRIFFFRKLLVAIREILKGGILINGNACHKNFLVKCKSLIQYRKVFSNSVVFDSLSLLNKIFVGKWRKYSWWKWRKKRKKIFTFKKRSSFRVIKKKKNKYSN